MYKGRENLKSKFNVVTRRLIALTKHLKFCEVNPDELHSTLVNLIVCDSLGADNTHKLFANKTTKNTLTFITTIKLSRVYILYEV